MRIGMSVMALAVTFGLAALPVAVRAADTETSAPVALPAGQPPAEIIPDQYIVMLDPDFPVLDVLRQFGIEPLFVYSSALHGFAAKLTPLQVEALEQFPGVLVIERDQVVHIATTQTNPVWGLDRVDQRNRPLSKTYTYNTTAARVHGYVLDTGIAAGHPEFEGRANNVFNSVGGPAADCHGHGTHVAGTIGSRTYGIAKQVRLHGVKVLDCNGRGTNSGVIAGVDWVTRNRVRPAVANLSIGSLRSPLADSSVDNLAESGVFVAVAAGNDNLDACTSSPAAAANVTTVLASDSGDRKASFSNYGSCAELYAPGVGIVSTWPGGRIARSSGTSMAAPHVTGTAALYKARHGDASYAAIRAWLIDNSTKGVIAGNPLLTPNRLLFKAGL